MEAPAGCLEYNTRRVSQFCWGPVVEKETDKSCRGQFLNSTQYLISKAKKKEQPVTKCGAPVLVFFSISMEDTNFCRKTFRWLDIMFPHSTSSAVSMFSFSYWATVSRRRLGILPGCLTDW